MTAKANCEFCLGTGIQRALINGKMQDHGECPCVAEDEPSLSFCYSHYRLEHVPDDVYRVCGECGHVYPQEINLRLDFLADYNYRATQESAPLLQEAPSGEEIFFCQHCIHDF